MSALGTRLLPWRRRPDESLRQHLLRLQRRGRYGSAELARDVLELLDRIERLEGERAVPGNPQP